MKEPDFSNLNAVYVNCTLKKSPQKSHTANLMAVSRRIMEREHVTTEEIRLIDHDVPNGVEPDMTKYNWDKGERWNFEKPE